VPEDITAFFDSTIKKLRLEEWEPRYILTPVAYGEIELVQSKKIANAKAEDKGRVEPEKKAEEKKTEEPAKAQPRPGTDPKTPKPATGVENGRAAG
jgi:hypothetical protein